MPHDDPHGECRHEIQRLEAALRAIIMVSVVADSGATIHEAENAARFRIAKEALQHGRPV